MRFGLEKKITLTIVLCLLFLAIFFFIINLFIYCNYSFNDYRSKIDKTVSASIEINSINIWNFDVDNINKYLIELSKEEFFVGSVFELSGFNDSRENMRVCGVVGGAEINNLFNSLADIAPNKKTYTDYMKRDITRDGVKIAIAHFYFSDKYIYSSIKEQVFKFIIFTAIFIIIFSFIIIYLMKKRLIEPLKQLHGMSLSLTGLTCYLQQNQSHEKWLQVQSLFASEKVLQAQLRSKVSHDELGDLIDAYFMVLDGFEMIVSELSQLSVQLQYMNDDLENRILQRTTELEESHKNIADSLFSLQQTKSQLTQHEKLASIGQLAAGVAHEINNPIGYIGSNLNRLSEYGADFISIINGFEKTISSRDSVPLSTISLPTISLSTVLDVLSEEKEKFGYDFLVSDFSDVINESQEGIKRVKDIVQSLKDFSHVSDENKFTEVDLNGAVKTTLKVLNNELKYSCDVVLNLQLNRSITANVGQLHQVISNLVVNASHAMKAEAARGILTITTEMDADFAIIRVSDTGGGIPKEIHSKLFDPFFTTKPIGQGTGLGLNICYDIIVNKHGGVLEFESELGKGTTFIIKLPFIGLAEINS